MFQITGPSSPTTWWGWPAPGRCSRVPRPPAWPLWRIPLRLGSGAAQTKRSFRRRNYEEDNKNNRRTGIREGLERYLHDGDGVGGVGVLGDTQDRIQLDPGDGLLPRRRSPPRHVLRQHRRPSAASRHPRATPSFAVFVLSLPLYLNLSLHVSIRSRSVSRAFLHIHP